MADYQTVSLPILGGMDTNTDKKLVPTGKVLLAKNAEISAGVLSKRRGTFKLSKDTTTYDSNISTVQTVVGAKYIAAAGDALLMSANVNTDPDDIKRLFAYSETQQQWVELTTHSPSLSGDVEMGIDSSQQLRVHSAGPAGLYVDGVDIAYSNGLYGLFCVDSAEGVGYFSCFDSNFNLINVRAHVGGTDKPKIIGLSDRFVLFAKNGTNAIGYIEISTEKAYSGSGNLPYWYKAFNTAWANLVTDAHSDMVYDVSAVGGTRYFIAYKDTTPEISLLQKHTDGSGDDTGTVAPTVTPGFIGCTWVDSHFAISYCLASHATVISTYLLTVDEASPFTSVNFHSTIMSHLAGATAITAYGTTIARHSTDQVVVSTTTNHINTTNFSAESNRESKSIVVDTDGSSVVSAADCENVEMYSRPYVDGTVAYFFAITTDNVVANLYLCALHPKKTNSAVGNVHGIGCYLPYAGPKSRSTVVYPNMFKVGNNLVTCAFRQDRLASDGVVVRSPVLIRLSLDENKRSLAYRDQTHLAGGFIRVHDGMLYNPTFPWVPQIESLTGQTGTGSMSDGTYSYSLVIEWQDPSGNIHRSATATPVSITLSGGTSDQSVDIDFAVPPRRIDPRFIQESVYTGSSATVYVARTKDSETTYFKTGVTAQMDDFTVADTAADSTIGDNEVLYTSGGVLDNDPPRAAASIAVSGNRLWYIAQENRSRVYASKKRQASLPWEFSDNLFVDALQQDDLTAIGDMDGKLIMYSANGISMMYGDGPSPTGAGSFPPVQKIPSSVGCTEELSLIETEIGHIFKSSAGYYLLDRGMQTHYIGYGVASYEATTVTGAVLDAANSRVIFTLSDGDTALVYQYNVNEESPRQGMWTVWGGINAVSCTLWNGKFTWADPGGQVYVRDETTYLNDESPVSMEIETPWYKLAGLSGYQRVRRFAVLGEFKSTHTLDVTLYYDYNDTAAETISVSHQSGFSTGGLIQFRRRIGKPRCRAIKFKLADKTIGGNGGGFALSDISVEAKIKASLGKTIAGA